MNQPGARASLLCVRACTLLQSAARPRRMAALKSYQGLGSEDEDEGVEAVEEDKESEEGGGLGGGAARAVRCVRLQGGEGWVLTHTHTHTHKHTNERTHTH